MPLQEGLEGGQQIMKPSNLLTRRRTVWTTVLLAMLLVASLTGLTGAAPGRLMLIPGIASSLAASSLAHANAQGISAPAPSAPATSPKQEQEQMQQLGPGQPTTPLERVLNKDGTLKLNTGFSSSV